MKKNEKEVSNAFSEQISQIANQILIVSSILIPTLILSFLVLRKKFLGLIYERIYSIENVYKQLSW
jgi:hypothetical protein